MLKCSRPVCPQPLKPENSLPLESPWKDQPAPSQSLPPKYSLTPLKLKAGKHKVQRTKTSEKHLRQKEKLWEVTQNLNSLLVARVSPLFKKKYVLSSLILGRDSCPHRTDWPSTGGTGEVHPRKALRLLSDPGASTEAGTRWGAWRRGHSIRVVQEGISPSKWLLSWDPEEDGPSLWRTARLCQGQKAPVGKVWDVAVSRAVTQTSSAGVCDENTWALLVSLMNTASHSHHPAADSLNSQRAMLAGQKKKKSIPGRGRGAEPPHGITRLSSPFRKENQTLESQVASQSDTTLPQKS